MTLDDLLELHRILGADALDVPGAEGQLRGPEQSVVVEDLENNVWHVPPSAVGITQRMQSLLAFASKATDKDEQQPFIHPISNRAQRPHQPGRPRLSRVLAHRGWEALSAHRKAYL